MPFSIGYKSLSSYSYKSKCAPWLTILESLSFSSLWTMIELAPLPRVTASRRAFDSVYFFYLLLWSAKLTCFIKIRSRLPSSLSPVLSEICATEGIFFVKFLDPMVTILSLSGVVAISGEPAGSRETDGLTFSLTDYFLLPEEALPIIPFVLDVF